MKTAATATTAFKAIRAVSDILGNNMRAVLGSGKLFRNAMALGVGGVTLLSPAFGNLPGFSETQQGHGSRYGMAAFVRCTREEEILKAFQLMRESSAESSLALIVNKPVRVVFKDMKAIHKGLKNYDALSWISNQGEQVIFINEKHRSAPPEALAAMLAHEAMHDDPYNSLNEEVAGWKREAQVWEEMKARNAELARIPAGVSPLVDRENRIAREARQGTLEAFVRKNPGYQGLAETSPGFGANTAWRSQPDAF